MNAANTGKVQLLLLQALRILSGTSDSEASVENPNGQFWKDVLGCLESGQLRADSFRIKPCAMARGGEEWFQLHLWPAAVLPVLKAAHADYRKFEQPDFRQRLKLEAGWQGSQIQRIGPENEPENVWLFNAQPDGRELYALCSFLWRGKLAAPSTDQLSPTT